MKHLFLDANVLMDFLLIREPFVKEAQELIQKAESKQIVLYISAWCYTDLYYFLRKSQSHGQAISSLTDLEKLTIMVTLSQDEVIQALNSDFSDFEDAVQHSCAVSEKKVEAIITRDRKGFKKSRLPVFSPKDALAGIR